MSENKKDLLKEGTIRRFMKLAGTQAISSDFLQETFYNRDADGVLEEAPEDELGAPEEELGVEAEPPVEDFPEEPLGAELEDVDDEEADDELEGSVEAFARDALEAFKGVAEEHGVEVEVEEMEEPEEIEVGEMEADPEEVGELEGELGPEEPTSEVEEGEEEAMALAEINYVDEEALMETVYKRVAGRLLKEKRTNEMADILAEKISKRLAKKSR